MKAYTKVADPELDKDNLKAIRTLNKIADI